MFAVRLPAFVAMGLALISAPALGQRETGSRIGVAPAQVPDHGSKAYRARVWLEGYAACVASRDPKRVANVLDANIGADVPMHKLSEINFESCLSPGGTADELRVSDRLFRGALYAERVTRTVRSQYANTIPPEPLALPVSNPSGTDATSRVSMVRFGECVMRQNPQASLAYVVADAGKPLETKAMDELRPALAACLNSGDKIELSKSILEAALAEAIYRTIHTSPSGKATR